jgi:hypothetical protein
MMKLIDYLSSIPEGAISDTGQIEDLLSECWDEFDGSNEERMEGNKLHGRMKDVSWSHPIISFVIERHGGTVQGSTRAENQEWEVNVEKKKAVCKKGRFTQVTPPQPILDARPIAEEITQLILNRQEDERLKWNQDGSVRLLIGKIIPEGSAAKQTVSGRRRRFREAVDELLMNAGWQKIRTNVYSLS